MRSERVTNSSDFNTVVICATILEKRNFFPKNTQMQWVVWKFLCAPVLRYLGSPSELAALVATCSTVRAAFDEASEHYWTRPLNLHYSCSLCQNGWQILPQSEAQLHAGSLLVAHDHLVPFSLRIKRSDLYH
jgi:hypothetical protein